MLRVHGHVLLAGVRQLLCVLHVSERSRTLARVPLDDTWTGWLRTAMADLVQRCGPEWLVAAPIFLPTDEHFPDVLEPGAVGVRTLVRRMLSHAGMGWLAVDLAVVDEKAHVPPRSPVELVAVEEGRVLFDMHEERDRVELLGFLCFETGHAFRASRRLDELSTPYRDRISEDPEVIDQLAAVTAVYLGFGVLAANAAHTYTSGGKLEGNWAYTYWKHSFAGALPFDAIAWVLALQTVVRASSDVELARVRGALRPNAKKAFDVARRELAGTRDALREELGLPCDDAWPVERTANLAPLPLDAADEALARAEIAEGEALAVLEREDIARRLVYRVPERRLGKAAFVGSLSSFAVFFGTVLGTGSAAAGLGVAAAVLLSTGFIVAMGLAFRCSDGDCRAVIPEDAERCPRCGARVGGEAASRADALDLPSYDDEG